MSAKKKFGLVLQGGGALGAYEVGAIECLYKQGMECAIVAGASSGALNATTLAGAKEYPPKVLRQLWAMFAVDPPVLFAPTAIRRRWSAFGVPHMYTQRVDYWNILKWTYVSNPAPLKRTLEDLLDWKKVRDPEHMRLFVSASGVEDGRLEYFSNLDTGEPFLPEHVLASGSLPVRFPWTVVGNRAFYDGGLTANTPLKPVIDHLRGDEPETMPIFMIDVFSSSAPRPANMQEVLLRMFEILLQNDLRNDLKRAGSYGRFIGVLKQAEEILKQVEDPSPELVALLASEDWKTVMNYAHVKRIYMIDMKKPVVESAQDFSHETISRRIGDGFRQTRSFLADNVPELLADASGDGPG